MCGRRSRQNRTLGDQGKLRRWSVSAGEEAPKYQWKIDMVRYKGQYLILIALVAGSVFTAGCASMIGFGIGYASDNSARSRTQIATALPLEPGVAITAIMKDSTLESGRYVGYCGPGSFQSADSAQTNNVLPYYGESIESVDTSGAASKYAFDGFFFHRIGQDWIPFMSVTDSYGFAGDVDLRSLLKLRRSEGTEISQSEFRNAFADRRLPSLSCIIITDSSRTAPIPLDEIDHLEAPLKKGAAKRGLLIGLIIDTVFWTTTYIVALTNWPAD
jgi:hypothetical protein